jgi:hypothetical protein
MDRLYGRESAAFHRARKSDDQNYFEKYMHKFQRDQNYLASSDRYNQDPTRHFYEQRIGALNFGEMVLNLLRKF